MQSDQEISSSLISAVCGGELERAKELISSFGLSYSRDWSDGYVLLCDALKNNHTEIAKLLLTNGSKVNNTNENPSMTPLHFAVKCGNIEIIEMLLDKGANIDAKCESGRTSLHDAVRWEKLKIVELLLKRGADVNAKEKYSKTCLHIAANEGYAPIVEHLLKHQADVNSECTYGGNKHCTPLYLAVKNGHETVVKLLLEYGANVDAHDQAGKTILYFAVENEYPLIVEHLLKYCPDVNNTSNRSALNVALHSRRAQYHTIAQNLLQYGFTVNLEYGDNCKLLCGAIEKGYLKIVEELIKYGVSIDSKDKCGRTALHIASEKNKQEIVEVLLKFGASINSKDEDDRTALHIACINRNLKIVELLLKQGASIDYKDRHGKTALHIASEKCNSKVVELLLKFGACMNSKDTHGKTALHIASEKRYQEIIEVLLKFGASVNSKDENGRTALHIATDKQALGIVEVLLKFGAIDSTDKYGVTALHNACKRWGRDIVIALLDHNSDITIEDKKGYIPLWFTEIFERHAVKVKTANLYVRNKNLLSINSYEELNEFRNECEKEVASMKSEKVGNVSFYDILTKDISELAIYAGNESIVQVFESDDYKIKFPIYATMINSNFRKGERRKDLLEHGDKIFHIFFTNFLGIPYDCTEKIFNYLSDDDLRSIIDACNPISVSSPNTDNN